MHKVWNLETTFSISWCILSATTIKHSFTSFRLLFCHFLWMFLYFL